MESKDESMTDALTEREAAVYDRQMRIFGVETQRRILDSKVLIIGMGAAHVELTKNTVLAGTSVALWDPTIVTDRHLGANFFLSADDVGKSRAEACLPAVRELNPLVSVDLLKTDPTDPAASADILKPFTIVCVHGFDFGVQERLNALCRAAGVKFISSVLAGLYGITFLDFGRHEYTVPSPPGSDKPSTHHVSEFVPLAEALTLPWSSLKRASPTFYAFLVVDAFRRQDSVSSLEEFAATFKASKGAKVDVVSDDLLRDVHRTWGRELTTVAAVLGGVLGQDIVRGVSRKDAPSFNFFSFDGTVGLGTLTALTP